MAVRAFNIVGHFHGFRHGCVFYDFIKRRFVDLDFHSQFITSLPVLFYYRKREATRRQLNLNNLQTFTNAAFGKVRTFENLTRQAQADINSYIDQIQIVALTTPALDEELNAMLDSMACCWTVWPANFFAPHSPILPPDPFHSADRKQKARLMRGHKADRKEIAMNPTLDTILDALADALVEKIAARLPPGGQQQTYTIAQLAERYGMSKGSIAQRVRAGEFGDTINAGTRTHLVTAAGVAKFESEHTGPAHDGTVGTYRPRRRTRRRDPGPI